MSGLEVDAGNTDADVRNAAQPMSMFRRLGCYLLDASLAVYVVVVIAFLDWLFYDGRHFGPRAFSMAYYGMAMAGVLFLYSTIMQARYGQTLGKMCGYLKVVKMDGSDITVVQAMVRAFFCFGIRILPYWVFVTAKDPLNFVLLVPDGYFAVNCLFAVADKENRRALHDMVAGTKEISLVRNASDAVGERQ